MNSRHSYGAPVSVLKFNNEEKVVMNKLELSKIFLHPEVEKRKVVIVSIVGPFRQGKSFFLNFCLRYMYANYTSISNPSNDLRNKDDWMGLSEESLTGFSWKSGAKRDTVGIIIWSDVFLHTNEKDEKVAIVLMDTQGLFDVKTLSNEGSIILALGTMLSSIQILNLFRDIHDIHLEFLRFAIDFAKIAADDDSSNLFQNFWFLIRDWYCPADYEFGIEGGRNYLKNVLDIKGKKDMSDIVDVRKYIKSTFEQLNCCLMPYPEKTVATEKKYDGSWGKMDKEFKETIEIFIPQILSPQNLVLKKICNKFLNCYEMKDFIESFFTLYESDNMPETRLVYDLTIEKQMKTLIDKCMISYKLGIETHLKKLNDKNMQITHELIKKETILLYEKEKKIARSDQKQKYRNELEKKIDNIYNKLSNLTMVSSCMNTRINSSILKDTIINIQNQISFNSSQ